MNLITQQLAKAQGLTTVSQVAKPDANQCNLTHEVSQLHITPYIYRGGYTQLKRATTQSADDFHATQPATEYTEAAEREAIQWADGCLPAAATELQPRATATETETFESALAEFGLTEVRTVPEDEVLKIAALMQRRGWKDTRTAFMTRAMVSAFTVVETLAGDYIAFERFEEVANA